MDNKTKLDYLRTVLLLVIFLTIIFFGAFIFRNAKEISSHPLQYAAESLGEGTECSCLVPSAQGLSIYSFNTTVVMFYEDGYTALNMAKSLIAEEVNDERSN